jgi:transposase
MEDWNSLSRFPKWALPISTLNKDIPSQISSELFGARDEAAKPASFFCRVEKKFLAYDTTSISSYSKSLKQVKYGMNKDHDPLQQMNLVLLFGESSRLPVYYRKRPGNMSDVKMVQNMLADIDFLKLDKAKLVMDRGFYSEDNINVLYEKHYKFLMATKTSLKLYGGTYNKGLLFHN